MSIDRNTAPTTARPETNAHMHVAVFPCVVSSTAAFLTRVWWKQNAGAGAR